MRNTRDIWNITIIITMILEIASPFSWIEEAGNIRSLVGNNATFTWTYIGPEADLEWSSKPSSDVILLYNMGREFPNGEKADRLHYIRYNGSASMMISNTTIKDSGRYEVKAIHPSEPQYIESQATLTVYNDLAFNISVDNTEYPLSYRENGSDALLPTYSGYLPRTFSFGVNVSPSSPSAILTLEKFVGESVQEMTSHEGFSLNSRISFNENDAQRLDDDIFRGQIRVTLEFGVQNVENISVSLDVIHGHHRKANRSVDVVVVVTFMTFTFASVVAILLLSLWRDHLLWHGTICHKLKRRSNSSPQDDQGSPSLTVRIDLSNLETSENPECVVSGKLCMTQEFKDELRNALKDELRPLNVKLERLKADLESTKNLCSSAPPPSEDSLSFQDARDYFTTPEPKRALDLLDNKPKI